MSTSVFSVQWKLGVLAGKHVKLTFYGACISYFGAVRPMNMLGGRIFACKYWLQKVSLAE